MNCNLHFRGLAEAVKRGVLLAGGLPLEFPTISLGENLMKPTAMLYRNLMAMDVEECIRAYPLDAVVLLGGCDKTIPAQLMGAASANVPAIMVTGGPSEAALVPRAPARRRHRSLALRRRAPRRTDERRRSSPSSRRRRRRASAHCNEMGTASTMASLVEALGMALPGHRFDSGGRRRARPSRGGDAAGGRSSLRAEGLGPTGS